MGTPLCFSLSFGGMGTLRDKLKLLIFSEVAVPVLSVPPPVAVTLLTAFLASPPPTPPKDEAFEIK